jgi:hypothetical protein
MLILENEAFFCARFLRMKRTTYLVYDSDFCLNFY